MGCGACGGRPAQEAADAQTRLRCMGGGQGLRRGWGGPGAAVRGGRTVAAARAAVGA